MATNRQNPIDQKFLPVVFIAACMLCLNTLPSYGQSAWPQWRGPNRDGCVADGSKWPKSIGEDLLRQEWRVALGPSYSGPVVSDSFVFTTETVDKTNEVVSALDRRTGEIKWKKTWPGSMKVPFFAKANGDWIRSTPAYDSKYLYVGGIRDVLVCLNAERVKKFGESTLSKNTDRSCRPLAAFALLSSRTSLSTFKLAVVFAKLTRRMESCSGGSCRTEAVCTAAHFPHHFPQRWPEKNRCSSKLEKAWLA